MRYFDEQFDEVLAASGRCARVAATAGPLSRRAAQWRGKASGVGVKLPISLVCAARGQADRDDGDASPIGAKPSKPWGCRSKTLTPTPEPAGYCAGDVAGERGDRAELLRRRLDRGDVATRRSPVPRPDYGDPARAASCSGRRNGPWAGRLRAERDAFSDAWTTSKRGGRREFIEEGRRVIVLSRSLTGRRQRRTTSTSSWLVLRCRRA